MSLKQEKNNKKKDLGIFYTPQEVVNFVFDILNIWKEKEDKETGRWTARKRYPSVIDPAVGEGVFLKAALEKGFTVPRYVFGVDIDEEVKKKWVKINLLKSFGSRAELNNHFFHQNGLLSLDEKKILPHKKGGLKEFDAVVGNPPYGGVGLGETELTDALIQQLANFEVLPESVKNNLITADKQADLFNSAKELAVKPQARQRIKSFPIEILFLERFIQLAKPGGWIAIVIPDGILTNSNSHYVREFIAKKTKVQAILSLPRHTFKNVGTSAKTSILFLQKYKEENEKADLNYPVFLASLESLEEKYFSLIKDNYYKFYNYKSMSTKNLTKIIKDQKGQEVAMIRVDETLKEMMEEKPASRWDPEYWHPSTFKILDSISRKNKMALLGQFVVYITYGVILTGEERQFSKDGVYYISSTTIRETGIDHSLNPLFVKPSDPRNREGKRPQYGDIILNRSGVGTLGRQCVFLYRDKSWTISDDTDLIRVGNISPFYVSIFLKTEFGLAQISQRTRGVSGLVKLNFDDIKAIKIPILPDKVQSNIESEYKKMSKYHDKAMEAKKKGDEEGYQKNIKTAEKMLKDLIAKTEAVIRGERDDVI